MMANLPVHPAATFETPDDYVAFEETLLHTKATAIVVLDDLFAVRMMQLVNLYGYRVPEDISLLQYYSVSDLHTHCLLIRVHLKF